MTGLKFFYHEVTKTPSSRRASEVGLETPFVILRALVSSWPSLRVVS